MRSLGEMKESYIGVLIITDAILLIYTIFFPVDFSVLNFIIKFDFITCLVIAIDFCYYFYKSDNRIEFLKNNWFTLIAMIPFEYFFINYYQYAVILRLFRFFKFFKYLFKGKGGVNSFIDFLHTSYLDRLIGALIFFILFSSFIILKIDPSFHNYFQSLWYVIVSLTTVGYGDIVPSTGPGKFIAVIMILIGLIFFSVLTGAISSIYVERSNKKEDNSIDNKIDTLQEEITELKNSVEELKDSLNKK